MIDPGDEIATKGTLYAITTVISATAGMVVSIERYTILGMLRVYTSGMFAMFMVWAYSLSVHWGDGFTIFVMGSACVFADYILVGVLNLIKTITKDPVAFIERWRTK